MLELFIMFSAKPSISGSSLSSSCSSEDGGAYKDVRIAVVGQGGVGKSGKHFYHFSIVSIITVYTLTITEKR